MVHFGKRLKALKYTPWEDHYLDYDKLKAMLEQQQKQQERHTLPTTKPPTRFPERVFVRLLNREIEKMVLFFLDQQGHIASRLAALRNEEWECVAQHDGGTKDSVTIERLNELWFQYNLVGEDMVHLIHYVDLNVTGVRKILKKHDKIYKANKLSDRYLSEHYWERDDSHLRQLFHYEGLGALVVTLEDSLSEIDALKVVLQETKNGAAGSRPPSLLADTRRHRRNVSAPGPLYSSTPNLSEWTTFTPKTSSTRKQQHLGPIKGSAQLASAGTLREYKFDSDASIVEDIPVLWRIDAARRRLKESSNFVQGLAVGEVAMIQRMSSEDELQEAAFPRPQVSRISSFLNLMSSFLYMTGYYIVAPSSGHYASMLGGSQALAGIIIGMTPIAALLSTLLYSWWSSYSYKSALFFASACSVLGNLLYALGLPYNNIMLVIVGRLLNGFGSARSINRRFIADAFPREERTAASAAFVSSGCLGMAAGPAIAALLDWSPTIGTIWSPENAPGWVMFALWSIYLIALIGCFQDPARHDDHPTATLPKPTVDIEMKEGETTALLLESQNEQDIEPSDDGTSSPPLWKNVAVMTTLFVQFVLKMVLECGLSSTATLTDYYFGWGAQESGIYLAVLGLLMFPANLLVAWKSRQYEDRELVVACLWILLVGVVGVVNYGSPDSYSVIQYISFGVVMFASANALEGPNMSLLSKTIPKSWAKGLFNVGLLATEAGTFGRAVGDIFITWCGLNSISHLLNNIFISLGVIVALTLAATYRAFRYLEPLDKDD